MWSDNCCVIVLRNYMDQHTCIPVPLFMWLSSPLTPFIYTSQCTEIAREVLNTLSDILQKYLQEDELYPQYYEPVYSQCHYSNVDCDKTDELHNELIQVIKTADEVEKVALIPQLEPYHHNLCR